MALILLVALSPLILAVALVVVATLGWPAFFTQERAGLEGAPFRIVKFRTMRPPRPGATDDASRLTASGRFLRASSLDELPSLWNIVKGDMAFVGPRPLLPEYDEHYDERQRRRLTVRPGLTGWCQVNGRNSLSWDEKMELDLWYVDHRSLLVDLKILVATPLVVVRAKGISHPGDATMPRFKS